MRRVAILALMALSLVVAPARAQSVDGPDDPDKRAELAQRIVERTWGDTRRTIEVMRDQIAATLPVDQRESFRELLNEHFDFARYKQLNALMMARHFTVAELSALDGFYASPEGQSVMQKMPLVMGEMLPFAQQMIIDAIRRSPREKRPPQFREL